MDRIVVDPRVHFGKPCVAGTRITVQDVLQLVDEDIPFSQIIRDYYPDLTVADIDACVQYAIAPAEAEDIHLQAQILTYQNRIERIPLKTMKESRGVLRGINTDVERDADRL